MLTSAEALPYTLLLLHSAFSQFVHFTRSLAVAVYAYGFARWVPVDAVAAPSLICSSCWCRPIVCVRIFAVLVWSYVYACIFASSECAMLTVHFTLSKTVQAKTRLFWSVSFRISSFFSLFQRIRSAIVCIVKRSRMCVFAYCLFMCMFALTKIIQCS